ncbi:Glycerol-3-phosphate dehydrogenase [Halopseudomonas yangmingensis]|uniref:Glycerol-3-phosphate dehydrogenase n=2 Tax=Halopseudomonas yangmingensis TaxID=1720063 RepID=A0A1I4N9Z0_9GAMM|nr:Glycerol-3-phosphate dehydrogenase [Halopseudomonas yangmingensis]
MTHPAANSILSRRVRDPSAFISGTGIRVMATPLQTDICIIGGGIAGLWLNARLRQRGYHTLLLEADSLGGGQTIRSQGIIHGGTKYALHGSLTQAAEAIAGMPLRWRACLEGDGELDLRGVQVLSQHHYLWSPGSLISKMAGFFASKALRGRVDAVSGEQLPEVFRDPAFRGKVYRLAELVLDVPSLLQRLAELAGDSLLGDRAERFDTPADGGPQRLICASGREIQAQRFVLSAGAGSEALLHSSGIHKPAMQRRPLQMVTVCAANLPPLYAHCLGASPKPRLTVTTHPLTNGEQCWYLGGELAEQGVTSDPQALIQRAASELAELLPWVNLQGARWDTLRIDRAEPAQSGLTRPDSAFVQQQDALLVCWPTKLALAPDLSDQVLDLLQRQALQPGQHPPLPELPHPPLAKPVWEH